MPKTIGNFYFKLTDAGNLIGEYSNADTDRSRPESAWRKCPVDKPSFDADYVATWYEPGSKAGEVAELQITLKNGSVGIFELVWSELKEPNKAIYRGQAMCCDGMLVGNYQSACSN
jgi:hypothetical protein